ncbi:hypothetical protein [Cellulomonas sp.]|uniref:hypothetical protein n=1 Tax=Cellulomonas sp. TaxID=40001 RepID=UPI002D6DD0B0|nr:hypothetical protein [Cellulomonas sp.]HYQ73723.1 hypothetical protein [Cellulomonas sp.]
MTRPTVAWYVHHHGSGHLGRLRAVAPHLDADVVALSSLPEPADLPPHVDWVRLDRDDEPDPDTGRRPSEADPAAGGLLHWAPLLHPGHRGRLARIARELDARGAAAVVVDVSVEVTVFARLLGVPPVLMAQPGVRDDEPHALGLRAAARVLAPWPADLVPAPHLEPVRDRVVFTGGISRFDGREAPDGAREGVLVLGGRGGSGVTAEHVDAAARATPGHRWTALGAGGAWTDDPWRELAGAGTVVSFAGQNSVADLAVAGARAVVVPQDRPFDEQAVTARALDRAGLAVVEPAWPEPARWPEVLDRAATLAPDWSVWGTAGAAARAAEAIADVARGRGAW